MLLMFFTIIVYVFFIYGVIEFSKKVYMDIINRGNTTNSPDIQVIIKDKEDLEYTIRSLKKDFNHIVILLDDEIEEIPVTLNDIAEGVDVEYIHLRDLGKSRE